MGKYLRKRGVIEMPTSHDVKLYKDQRYIYTDAVYFLEKNGFVVNKIESNDRHGGGCDKGNIDETNIEANEVNIYFERV